MKTMRWTTSRLFRLVSFLSLPFVLLILGSAIHVYGGLLPFYAEVYAPVLILGPLSLISSALLVLFQLVALIRMEGDSVPRWREWCCTIFLCVFFVSSFACCKALFGSHSVDDHPPTPYISQGVLPLLEQMEEADPDFSVQKPIPESPDLLGGFINIYKSPLRPKFLILRQDGDNGEWYNIMYWEFYSEALAADYAQFCFQRGQAEGGTLEAVQGLEDTFYGHTVDGWETMLAHQGKRVTQVTYEGEKSLRSCVARWREAILPAA